MMSSSGQATALEIYVSGSLNVFNHQTTVDLKNRVVCYDIKDLGSHLKKIGMMIIQDQVWNRVSENRKARSGKPGCGDGLCFRQGGAAKSRLYPRQRPLSTLEKVSSSPQPRLTTAASG